MNNIAEAALKRALINYQRLPTSVLDELDPSVPLDTPAPMHSQVEPEAMLSHPEEHEKYDSRTADKFVLRLEPGMRDQVRARGKLEARSMNAVMVFALRRYLEGPEEQAAPVAESDLLARMEVLVARMERQQ